MSGLCRSPLPYFHDSSHYLTWLTEAPCPLLLDSGKPDSERGRYSLICADPAQCFSFTPDDATPVATQIDRQRQAIEAAITDFEHDPELPFCGGAIGYISYELGEQHLLARKTGDTLPSWFTGIYDWVIVVDHQHQKCELVVQAGSLSAWPDRLRNGSCSDNKLPSFALTEPFASSLDWPAYLEAFNAVQDYIRAGDCYQINLTRQFNARYQGSPLVAYRQLRNTAAAPFSAYWDFGAGQLLSLSPERFICAEDGRLHTQPIKGTARRSDNTREDRQLADALQSSEKNRAENVMIVDLLRNDLGRNCIAGSVNVDALLELQSFRTVHHLVSTISGELMPSRSPLQALLDCFPGGSITGAPKRRAMEIIAELEPSRRSLYCGSLFYLGSDGRMDSNILIRSFVCQNGEIRGWAGGGIVADSVADEEFRETEEKLGKLMTTLAESVSD